MQKMPDISGLSELEREKYIAGEQKIYRGHMKSISALKAERE